MTHELYDEVTGLMIKVQTDEERAAAEEAMRVRDAEWDEQQRQRLADLGLSFGVGPADRESYENAVSKALAESPCSPEFEPTIDANWAVRGPGWWLVPYGWIGCAGHFVYDVGPVVVLGSGPGIWPPIWMAQRGLHPQPDTVTVRINRVNNAVDSRNLLSMFLVRSFAHSLVRDCEKGPVEYEGDWRAPSTLLDAEQSGAYEFEILNCEPPPPSDWLARWKSIDKVEVSAL